MSLINKMLQDLDARGSRTGEALQVNVKVVPMPQRRVPVRRIGALVALVIALAAAGVLGWRYFKRPRPVPTPATVLVPAAPVPVPAEAPAAPVRTASKPAAAPKQTVVTPVPAVRTAEAPRAKLVADTPGAPAPLPADGREMSAQQRAESEYRRALASMQEGRIGETLASLEQSLALDPRHEAARQTLVTLLLESKRTDEAVRHLQLGLSLEPRQPAMAMLLARLQIERGGPAIDTLMRTLPYAAASSDYQAFLAGALQRAQRHGEAAGHFQLALRGAPDNGVWWIGLGNSLQAEKRDAEAVDAFQHAKSTGTLTPELQALVERKLQQLAR